MTRSQSTGVRAVRVGYLGTACVRVHEPAEPSRAATIIVCPPIGYEESCARHGLIAIARTLAANGYQTLRIDYPGTADSGGDADLDRWIDAVTVAVDAAAPAPVILCGIRIGGLVAALAAERVVVSGLAVWAPVVSGRRYVRELQAMRATRRVAGGHDAPDAMFAVGGFVFDDTLLKQIRAADLLGATPPNTAKLLIDSPEKPCDPRLTEHWHAVGGLDVSATLGTGEWLDTSPEIAVDPAPTVLLDWLLDRFGETAPAAPFWLAPALRVEPGGPTERPISVGPIGLDAILHEPSGTDRSPVAKLLLNTGAEHHLGPGRDWVSLARRWAADGHLVLRLDTGGIAESPVHPGQNEQETYGRHHREDIAAGAEALHANGAENVIVIGLCSGAYAAIEAGPQPGVAAVIAVNPQLYRYGTRPGNEAGLGEHSERIDRIALRRHRLAELDRRFGLRRRWHGLADRLGHRHGAIRWLEQLADGRVATVLVFGDQDPGLWFLERRGGPTLARLERSGRLTIIRHPTLDHPMHEPGPRAEVVARIDTYVRTLTTPPASR